MQVARVPHVSPETCGLSAPIVFANRAPHPSGWWMVGPPGVVFTPGVFDFPCLNSCLLRGDPCFAAIRAAFRPAIVFAMVGCSLRSCNESLAKASCNDDGGVGAPSVVLTPGVFDFSCLNSCYSGVPHVSPRNVGPFGPPLFSRWWDVHFARATSLSRKQAATTTAAWVAPGVVLTFGIFGSYCLGFCLLRVPHVSHAIRAAFRPSTASRQSPDVRAA
jgi:hypothetical protein